MASIDSVDTEEEYVHVRFNDPDRYDTIRTPDWAKNAAESVGEDKAKEQAKEIYDKIEE